MSFLTTLKNLIWKGGAKLGIKSLMMNGQQLLNQNTLVFKKPKSIIVMICLSSGTETVTDINDTEK